ncbi:MAG: hypothetical protein JW934_03140 [Anaerolineae bacterium]|nr:hypothetical protein [Anaerolineae bacterium]
MTKPKFSYAAVFVLLCLLALLLGYPYQVMVKASGLPPRPEPAPTPVAGGLIELRINFDPTWSWDQHPWQAVDTLVQWKDALGGWHDVDTWRGGLDEVAGYEGRKSWWLSREHFGTGPFRWAIYLSGSEEPLKFSKEFFMPNSDGGITRTRITLP